MRKTVLFLIFIFTLLYFGKADLCQFNDSFKGEYTVYSKDTIGEKFFAVNGEAIYVASGIDIFGVDIQAETITITGEFNDIKQILKKLFVVYYKQEKINDIYILYGYSPRLKGAMLVDGFLQNVQITFCDGVITISNPINLGSF